MSMPDSLSDGLERFDLDLKISDLPDGLVINEKDRLALSGTEKLKFYASAVEYLSTKFSDVNALNIDFSQEVSGTNTDYFEKQLNFSLQVQELKERLTNKCMESVFYRMEITSLFKKMGQKGCKNTSASLTRILPSKSLKFKSLTNLLSFLSKCD